MKRKILIIDAVSNYLYFIKRVLINEGYEVKITSSEAEFTSYLHDDSPNLILVDVKLNNDLGFEYIRKIRKELNIDIPAIVISKGTNIKEIEKAFDYGVNDYLIKPLNIRDLKNKISASLENATYD